jgi:hypothetical protein
VSLKASAIGAMTLARSAPVRYQVTYWSDGVARFDGQSGHRQGAWEAQVDAAWFRRVRKFATNLESGYVRDGEASTTVIVDADGTRLTFEAPEGAEPADLWTLSTLIDGVCQRTRWAPLDPSGEEDFAPFSAGVPVWMSMGQAVATGYGLPGAILVLGGAQASTSTSPSLEGLYQERRAQLIDDGSLVLEADAFHLTRHLVFTSPSAAASVLLGSNTSGRRAWRDGSGRAWSELGLDG